MIEIKNSIIAHILGWNLVLYPFILYDGVPDEYIVKHERCHFEQIERDGVVAFYWNYISEYVINLSEGMDLYDAYYNINYESEARKCEE